MKKIMKKMKNSVVKIFVFLLCAWVLGAAGAWALPNYQLRDVSGERDGHTIAGSQWFATALEWFRIETEPFWSTRGVTVGGQAPEVTMVTSADLIEDFAPVYVNDPLYNNWNDNAPSFDVLESAYLVIKEGRGELNLDFGNDYARHAPFGPQDAMEDVLLSVPGYTTRVSSRTLSGDRLPQLVPTGDRLPVSMYFQGESPQGYGSQLGYLTFRQSSSFDVNFSGYRESIKIPLVVANVFDGPASEPGSELYFDMSIFDGGEIVTRKKFRWGADSNETRDMGTFFMMRPAGAAAPVYNLTTQVTNRTGTRYRWQRYDSISTNPAYNEMSPSYWAYDLTPDLYGSLPASFSLDPQSQIAPGLVTTYLSDMDMTYGSDESFRLYPYQGSSSPSDLRLTFRKVGGMTPYGASVGASSSPWTVGAFNMTFVDVVSDDENTAREIAGYAAASPVMPPAGYTFTGAANYYFKADAFNSLMISADVPGGLVVDSDDAALLPVRVRLRISRQESPIVGRWDDIANAENVLTALSQVCTIWVRSPNAAELDMNLFSTLSNRGYGPERCIQAFTYGNFIYVDFIVLLADSESKISGKTAFCQVVEDDDVPYILIGDGEADGAWTLGFYVDLAGQSPGDSPTPVPSESRDGGGGGCSTGAWGMLLALLLLPFVLTAKFD